MLQCHTIFQEYAWCFTKFREHIFPVIAQKMLKSKCYSIRFSAQCPAAYLRVVCPSPLLTPLVCCHRSLPGQPLGTGPPSSCHRQLWRCDAKALRQRCRMASQICSVGPARRSVPGSKDLWIDFDKISIQRELLCQYHGKTLQCYSGSALPHITNAMGSFK